MVQGNEPRHIDGGSSMKKLIPLVLLRKTSKHERAHEVVSMNKFLWWIRIFIVIVMIGFIGGAIGGWKLYQYHQEVVQTQKDGHQDRLNEDADLQKQIADAVCTFVDPIPPGENFQVDKLRKKYGCPFTPTSVAP